MLDAMDDALVVDCRLIEVVERLAVGDAAYGLGKEPVARKHTDLRRFALQGYGVRNNKLLKIRILNLLDGIARQDGVRNHSADALGAAGLDDARSLADGRARIDQVVQQDDVLALHIANQAHLADLVGLVAVFVAYNEAVVQRLGIHSGALAATHIGRSEHHILDVELLADIRHKERRAEQVVDRDVEKALYLVGVKVHRDETVDTGGDKHIGNQARRNGDVRLVLAVLTRKTIIRNNSDNLARRCALDGIDHHKELEKIVGRGSRGLNNKNYTATDSFLKRGLEFTVGILENGRVAQGNSIDFGHATSQVVSGSASENEYFIRCLHLFLWFGNGLQKYYFFLDYKKNIKKNFATFRKVRIFAPENERQEEKFLAFNSNNFSQQTPKAIIAEDFKNALVVEW